MNLKKVFFIMALLSVLFFFTNNVKADCDYNRQYELNQIASNVKVNYVVSSEPELYFTINIFNVTKDIYAEVYESNSGVFNNYLFSDIKNGSISFNNYQIYEKTEYIVSIKSFDKQCDLNVLRTISITTPRYNPYYNTKLCKENRTHSLCSKWYDFDLSYDDLKERVQNSTKMEKTDDSNSRQSWYKNILNYVLSNYILFTIIFIIIILVIILLNVKIKKEKKYEK